MHYAVELLQWMVNDGLEEVDVSEAATKAFVDDVDANLQNSAWVQCGSAHGYYRDKGQKVILAVPRHNSRIWHDLRVPRKEDFNISKGDDLAPVEQPPMKMLTI